MTDFLSIDEYRGSPAKLQQALIELRHGLCHDQMVFELRKSIKIFQNKRLSFTHKLLLEDKKSTNAASFFLTHLYGAHDVSRRDHQVGRVLPKLERYLPSAAVEVVSEVIFMDYLTEYLDTQMALHWADCSSEPRLHQLTAPEYLLLDIETPSWHQAYIKTFRRVGYQDLRHLQVELVSSIGMALVKLTRFPLLKGILRMTRGAAQKADLEDFHDFLSLGLESFTSLRDPNSFFVNIQRKERELLSTIFSGGEINLFQ